MKTSILTHALVTVAGCLCGAVAGGILVAVGLRSENRAYEEKARDFLRLSHATNQHLMSQPARANSSMLIDEYTSLLDKWG